MRPGEADRYPTINDRHHDVGLPAQDDRHPTIKDSLDITVLEPKGQVYWYGRDQRSSHLDQDSGLLT